MNDARPPHPQPRPGTPMPEATPHPARRGGRRWLVAALLAALAIGLAYCVMAPAPVPVAEAPAPAATDVSAGMADALASISAALTGITDPASAETALPGLTDALATLNGFEDDVAAMPDAGRTSLQQIVAAALPAIRENAARLKTDGPVAAVVGPVVDDILAELTAYSA